MCEHLGGCSMLEKGGPRYALPLCANGKDRERGLTPKNLDREMGNANQIGARK